MSEKTSPIIRPLNYTSRTTIPYNSSMDYRPQMHPNIKPKFSLYTLEESYPDQFNTLNSCKNGASFLFITQRIYQCYFLDESEPRTTYRVTKDTYNIMTRYPYYRERSNCTVTTEIKKVCNCPSGYSDYLCET